MALLLVAVAEKSQRPRTENRALRQQRDEAHFKFEVKWGYLNENPMGEKRIELPAQLGEGSGSRTGGRENALAARGHRNDLEYVYGDLGMDAKRRIQQRLVDFVREQANTEEAARREAAWKQTPGTIQ